MGSKQQLLMQFAVTISWLPSQANGPQVNAPSRGFLDALANSHSTFIQQAVAICSLVVFNISLGLPHQLISTE